MTDKTYRAAIYRGIRDVDIVDLPYPECGEEDVVVRNLITGVCGSDVSAYFRGGGDHMIWADHEFGHEGLSEVVEVGSKVVGLAPGDHVFVNQGYALRDMNRMATVGAFSEYVRIPRCEVGYSVFLIDRDIAPRTAVLFEPFTIGTRGVKTLSPGPDKTAIVFGAGIIGICSAIMLKWFGCSKVMIVDFSSFRLEKAREFGLVTCNPKNEDLKATAYAEFGTSSGFFGEEECAADIYVDAVGVKAVIDDFRMLAKRSAILAIIGIHHEPVTLDLAELCSRDWRIKGCGDTPNEEAYHDILALMRSGRHDLSSLVTHEYGIEEIRSALEMGARADEAQKVCITF